MLRFIPPVTLRLECGRLLRWPRQSGVRLHVLAGTAWVTQAHDLEDHFLQPGQTLTLRPGARAIIGAERDLTLRFEADRRFGLALLGALLRRWHAPGAAPWPTGVRSA